MQRNSKDKYHKMLKKKFEDFGRMFYRCINLKELNLSNLKTDNVINMREMFWECFLLKELNLSNFCTDNVNDMSRMFWMFIIRRIKSLQF